MRDIKFRGKTQDEEWVYGHLTTWRNKDKSIDYQIKEGHENSAYTRTVIIETVGQYTGLKDKKGKEIYEGDIYHMGDKNIKYVVVWNDTGLTGKQLGSSSYAGLSYWQNNIEIIGNIYDNPELLSA